MTERDIITAITGLASSSGVESPDLLKGIGDDCAVVERTGTQVWLLTMDSLVEGVHFDSSFHPPEKLGRKSVSVNVSDIAAMGGQPRFVLLSLGLPSNFDRSWFDSFIAGFTNACERYGCLLIGGDTVKSKEIMISLTVIGEMEKEKVIYRDGAAAGDDVWVSGVLGRAAAGLSLCQDGIKRLKHGDRQLSEDSISELKNAHFDPKARVQLGQILAESGFVKSMMDISDGIATDLAHICKKSGVGALIEADCLPFSPALEHFSTMMDEDIFSFMLSGGEDFELLFSTQSQNAKALQRLTSKAGYTIYKIGQIVPGSRVEVVYRNKEPFGKARVIDMSYRGYDHFS